MNVRDVVIAPVITEKSMQDAGFGKFTFKVEIQANKPLIKQAIEERFKVKVLQTFVSIVKGRTDKKGVRRQEFVKSAWKKATVKLPKDQKIALFDTAGQEAVKS